MLSNIRRIRRAIRASSSTINICIVLASSLDANNSFPAQFKCLRMQFPIHAIAFLQARFDVLEAGSLPDIRALVRLSGLSNSLAKCIVL